MTEINESFPRTSIFKNFLDFEQDFEKDFWTIVSRIPGTFKITNKKEFSFVGSLKECIASIDRREGKPFSEVEDWLLAEDELDGGESILEAFVSLGYDHRLVFDGHGFTLQLQNKEK